MNIAFNTYGGRFKNKILLHDSSLQVQCQDFRQKFNRELGFHKDIYHFKETTYIKHNYVLLTLTTKVSELFRL